MAGERILHLAIPIGDIPRARGFYEGMLGCRVAREYADRLTLDFFGMQLVCHLAPDRCEPRPEMYPRHFGVTFRERADFDACHDALKAKDAPFFAPLFCRFEGRREEHRTFFLKDPFNNVIEFKWYLNPEMMY